MYNDQARIKNYLLPMIAHTTQDTFSTDVIAKKGVVFVDFYAEWCQPCKLVTPILEEMADGDYKGKVEFLKIDVDENQQVAGEHSIFSIPTFVIFKDGQPVHRFSGVRDKDGFKSELDKFVD